MGSCCIRHQDCWRVRRLVGGGTCSKKRMERMAHTPEAVAGDQPAHQLMSAAQPPPQALPPTRALHALPPALPFPSPPRSRLPSWLAAVQCAGAGRHAVARTRQRAAAAAGCDPGAAGRVSCMLPENNVLTCICDGGSRDTLTCCCSRWLRSVYGWGACGRQGGAHTRGYRIVGPKNSEAARRTTLVRPSLLRKPSCPSAPHPCDTCALCSLLQQDPSCFPPAGTLFLPSRCGTVWHLCR